MQEQRLWAESTQGFLLLKGRISWQNIQNIYFTHFILFNSFPTLCNKVTCLDAFKDKRLGAQRRRDLVDFTRGMKLSRARASEGHMATMVVRRGIDMEGTSPFQAAQTREKAHRHTQSYTHTLGNHSAETCRWLRRGGQKRVKKPDLNEREWPLAVSGFDSVVRGHSD